MVEASKTKDKAKERYDPMNYITKDFCESQFAKQKGLCHYCPDGPLMLVGVGINRQTNRLAATIERLDNSRGHNQDNCVLCHAKCQKKNHPNTKKKIDPRQL